MDKTIMTVLSSALLLVSTGCSITTYNQARGRSIPVIYKGIYPVACSPLVFDTSRVGPSNAGNILNGGRSKDRLYYVTDALASNTGGLLFDVQVPVDKDLYGNMSGKTLPCAGIVLYPTTAANTNKDVLLPFAGGFQLARMDTGGGPQFAEDGVKYPLVVFSHGYTAHPLYHLRVMEVMASHGYVVVGLFHGDNRFQPYLFAGNNAHPQQLALRVLALQGAIDWLKNSPDYGRHIDFEKISGVGVSFGGTTVTALGGGKIRTAGGMKALLQQTPLCSIVGHSPYMGQGGHNVWGKDGTADMTIPALFITGTADTTAPFNITSSVIRDMKGVKYLAGISGMGHSFTPAAMQVMETLTVLFLDAYVKGDKGSMETLNSVQTIEKASLKAPFRFY